MAGDRFTPNQPDGPYNQGSDPGKFKNDKPLNPIYPPKNEPGAPPPDPNKRAYQPLPNRPQGNFPPPTPPEPKGSGNRPVPGRAPVPPPKPPSNFFQKEDPAARQQKNRSGFRTGTEISTPKIPGTRNRKLRKYFLYGGILSGIVVLLIGLYVVTRLTNLFSGISVPRIDVNGQAVSGSNVSGNGKVTILLIGLDSRDDPAQGMRSDTMILVSVNQSAKTASMLSIPRDLWVEVPGHGKNRINSGYFFGEQDHPGSGGPPLAKLTVEKNLGIPVHYFAQVDFNGFRDVVDAIGGITINVKKPLIDSEYPTEDYGIKRIFIPAGIQHMDGQTALEYARSRHSDSDLGRNQRQQEVLQSIRERGVNLGLLTNDKLSAALQESIKTDLQWNEVLSLAQTAIGLDRANIKSYSIDANVVQNQNIGGMDVLVPDWDAVRKLVDKFYNS